MAKKRSKKNISGLRNQPSTVQTTSHGCQVASTAPVIDAIDAGNEHDPDSDCEWDTGVKHDSVKTCWDVDSDEEEEEDVVSIGVINGGEEVDHETLAAAADAEDEAEAQEAADQEFKNDGLYVAQMILAIDQGDDPRDEDWVPDHLARKRLRRKTRACNQLIL